MVNVIFFVKITIYSAEDLGILLVDKREEKCYNTYSKFGRRILLFEIDRNVLFG